MIDARAAVGVPCITTCPFIIPRGLLVAAGVDLDDWQKTVMRGHGFLFADESSNGEG